MLRPHPITRRSNALVGAAEALLGVALLLLDARVQWLAYAFIAQGAYLAYRGYTLAVETHPESVRVRGLFRTATISRANVRNVTDFPAISWVDGRGRKRWTPVTPFLMPGRLRQIREHASRSMGALRRWAEE